ncbi:MAG: type II secretion system protein [Phycisphaera sp.]|nr:type II secretion system protein [Phycisphaera sp.]
MRDSKTHGRPFWHVRSPRHARDRGFTIIELLVVMGILVLLAVLTGIGVNRISKGARLSSGVNQVKAAMGAARSYAIQNNKTVMLAFDIVVDADRPANGERVRMVLAEATGEYIPFSNYGFNERYLPVPGLPVSELPRGVKVAGPLSTVFGGNSGDSSSDNTWVTQPGGDWLVRSNGDVLSPESGGRRIGVIFGPDGTLLTRNPAGVGAAGTVIWPYVDLDGDGDFGDSINYPGVPSNGQEPYITFDAVGDECDVVPVQWLAVFDDEEMRRTLDESAWDISVTGDWDEASGNYHADVTNWVDSFGVPLFFSRYTGVAETVSR